MSWQHLHQPCVAGKVDTLSLSPQKFTSKLHNIASPLFWHPHHQHVFEHVLRSHISAQFHVAPICMQLQDAAIASMYACIGSAPYTTMEQWLDNIRPSHSMPGSDHPDGTLLPHDEELTQSILCTQLMSPSIHAQFYL